MIERKWGCMSLKFVLFFYLIKFKSKFKKINKNRNICFKYMQGNFISLRNVYPFRYFLFKFISIFGKGKFVLLEGD